MKLNLPDVSTINSISTINSNFTKIEEELQNKVLYRNNPEGEPNTLETDVDANGQDIFNAGAVKADSMYIGGERIVPSGVVVVTGDIDPTSVLYKANNLSDLQSAANARVNLGLGNVNNTSDVNKPVSAATASALAGKQDTLVSGTNIKTVNGNSVLGSGDLVLVGVGETNTTSNLGTGVGLAASKVGTNLPFKSLIAGTGVTITPSTNDVTISATVDTSNTLLKTNNLSDVQSAATSRINLGLGNVDNTSDLNKPISTATSSALASKQATLVSGSNIKTVNGVSILGSGNLAVGTPWLNVVDFGANNAGTSDSATAFQNTVNALPAGGGRIIVPDGIFNLSFEPNIGTKSVYWDISPSTTFTGAGTTIGKFPYVSTVGGQKSVGPLIKSQSMVNVGDPNGGIAAFQVDMLQPDSYGAGNSLAGYFGAKSNNPNSLGNSWALNTVINVGNSAQGTHQCIEVDVDNASSSALVKGISISGIGTANPDVGIEIVRGPVPVQTYWDRGIDILYSTMGIQIRDTCSGGISINAPTQTLNTPIGAKQRISGGDTIVLQRNNDSTVGNFIRGVNSTNTTNQFTIDGFGNAYFQQGTFDKFVIVNDQFAAKNIYISQPAATGPAGVLNIGNQLFGSAGGLVGYIEIFIGSTPYKIPYYTW